MSIWEIYPPHYRQAEVQSVVSAVQAGDCVSVVGLSGAGKSNLLGFLANRVEKPRCLLVDCNRLEQISPQLLFRQVRYQLGNPDQAEDELAALDFTFDEILAQQAQGVCLLLDRFDMFVSLADGGLFSNLRLLRDRHKYQLTLVTATRHLLPADNELAELFFAHTIWLGALSAEDACWSASSFAARHNQVWDEDTLATIISLTGGYPALLRAVCEAFSAGVPLDLASLLAAPPVRTRLAEFWSDRPGEDELHRCGLVDIPLLKVSRLPTAREQNLTAKEQRLLDALRAHPNQLCEKDDLIRRVWSDDRVFMQGVRDDSLAQLVRRLREKIEIDPASPFHIQTAPGRGYIYHE
jgi:hypothetical protein